MAEQAPFDPGGTSSGNGLPIETDKSKPLLFEPYAGQTPNDINSGTPDAGRYRATTFPYPSNSSPGYAQYNQTWASGQTGNPLSVPPLNLHLGPCSQQPYDAASNLPYSAHLQGSFGVQHSPTSKDRRHSVPRYHPYMITTTDHASRALQGQSPVRSASGHLNTTSYTTILSPARPHNRPAEKPNENILPQPVDSHKLAGPPPQIQKVSASESPVRLLALRPQANGRLAHSPKENSQAEGVMSVVKSMSVLDKSVHDVFNDEQCDKILWLALHGIPKRAVAHLLTIGGDGITAQRAGLDKKTLIDNLSTLAQYFVPELATGQNGKEDPDVLVERLLSRGDSLYWSPFLLKHAIDYTFVSDDGEGAEQERLRNARERNAGIKWKNDGNNDYPADTGSGGRRKRRNSDKASKALGGIMRQASEQDIIEEHFGYREGSHQVEVALMKHWLLTIRELGRLPDRSEVPTLEVQEDASVNDAGTV